MNPKKISLHAYFLAYIRPRGYMSYPTFAKRYKILLSDKSFVENFGAYKFRALNRNQISILHKEFIND